MIKSCKDWYEKSYSTQLFMAQRLYPNEELLRFMGREFFSKTDPHERSDIKVLELGCGSCSNLWMIAREGFDSYGVDLSEKSIELGHKMLGHWGVCANLDAANMCKLPYSNTTFDVVIDVYSSCCLTVSDFRCCLDEVKRVLKPGGLFFSFTPSSASDVFKQTPSEERLDRWTLKGIPVDRLAFGGNLYPFRFMEMEDFKQLLLEYNIETCHAERIGRTYGAGKEYFEFLSVAGRLAK